MLEKFPTVSIMEKQPIVFGNEDGGNTSVTAPAFYVLVKQPQASGKSDQGKEVSNQDDTSPASSSAIPIKSKVKTCLPADCISGGITVTLDNNSMWNEFYHRSTEMILTKQGRRMFPYCRYWISGLESNLKYILIMDISPVDNFRYKWNGHCWEPSGKAEPHVLGRVFMHPESPSSGNYWMHQPVSFYKLKLTNNTLDQEGHIILHSMHRYLPRLHLVPADKAIEVIQLNGPDVHTFTFPQTEFFAVTAYQNIQITQLKIDYNPFAKGFRDDGLSSKPHRDVKQNGSSEQEEGSIASPPSNHRHPTEGGVLEQRSPSLCRMESTALEKELFSTDHDFVGVTDMNMHGCDSPVLKQEESESPIASPCQSSCCVASPLNSNGNISVVVKEEPADDYDYGPNVCMKEISVKQEETDEETEDYPNSDNSIPEKQVKKHGEMGGKEMEVESRKRPRSTQLGVAKAKMLKLDSGKMPVVYLEPCAVTRNTVKVSALSHTMLSLSKSEKYHLDNSEDSLSQCFENDNISSPFTVMETEEMRVENHFSGNNIPDECPSFRDVLWENTDMCSNLTVTKKASSYSLKPTAYSELLSGKDICDEKKTSALKAHMFHKGIVGNQKVVLPGPRKRGRPRKMKLSEVEPPSKYVGKSVATSNYAPLGPGTTQLDVKPDLEDVDGMLFVAFASKEALDIHTVDRSEEKELPDMQAPLLAARDSSIDSGGQRIQQLEKDLLEDLKSFKYKQVIHPSLQEVGLKLNLVDPTVSIDLKYLGVQLPLSYSDDYIMWKTLGTSSNSADTGLPFVSRTGKTNDFTKIKGWRGKLHSSSKNESSILEGSLKNRSAFCSDKLDEYLENEGKLMETSMEFSPSTSSCPVVYQLPTKSTSYVRTLDSVLKKQSAGPPSDSYIFKPLSVPSVSKKKRTNTKKIKTKKQAAPRRKGKPPHKPAQPLPVVTKKKHHLPVLEEKVMKSQPSSQIANEVDASVVPGAEENVLGKQIPVRQAQQQQQSSRLPSLSKTQLKLMDLEDCALWDGKPRTYITEERADLSLTTLLTAQASLKNKPIHKIVKRRAPPCNNDFCRLGCVCSSLALEKRQPTHCRKPDCMFGCTCLKRRVVLVKGGFKHKNILDKSMQARHKLYSRKQPEQEKAIEKEQGKLKARDKKRRKKMEYTFCDAEPETPVRSFPLWIKVDGEMDPEPMYIPTPSAAEPTKPIMQSVPEVFPSDNKPSSDGIKSSSSGAKPGRVYTPKPNPVIREEDKDPVYLYFESKMTCARVRIYEHKKQEKKQQQKCLLNSEQNTEKEHNPEPQPPKMEEDKESGSGQKSWWFSCNADDPSTSYVHHTTPGGTTKLIEIVSDCNWEEDRNEILNILSQHVKSKMPKSLKVGNFVIDLESATKTWDERNTPIYSSRVKISMPSCQNKDEKACISVSESPNDRLSPCKRTEKISFLTPGMLREQRKKGLPFYAGLSPAGNLAAHTYQSDLNPSCLIQVNGKNYPQAKLLLGQMGALHPANRLAAYITGRLRPTVLDLSSLSTVISKVASSAKPASFEPQSTEVSTSETSKTSSSMSTSATAITVCAPAQKQIVLTTVASTATVTTTTLPIGCVRTGPSGIQTSPLSNQSPGATSPPGLSPGAEKRMGPRLLLIPVHQGSPTLRPAQNIQPSQGQGKRMILQPLRNPGGVNLYRHPNGQIIQLVPLHQFQPTRFQPSLSPVAFRSPGPVVGIQLPGPSTLSETTMCQSASASSVIPATMAPSVLCGSPSSLPTPSTELPRVMPALPPVLSTLPPPLLEAPTAKVQSVLLEAPTAEAPSALPEIPAINQTLQTIRSVPASISATQAASIIPPVPAIVSQTGSLTLRITPSGVKNIASHTNSDSKTICSMNGQPDSTLNLIPLQSGSFALLQFPGQKDVSGSTVKQNVSLGVKNTDHKDEYSTIHLEEKASNLQEVETVESEVRMPDTKPKENYLPANQPDSHSEEITDDINAITSDLPEKSVEIMEQLSTGPPIFQPDIISSDHAYMSEKSKCEEIKMMVKMKQHAKQSKRIPDKVPCNSETVHEECSQIPDLAQSTLQEQKHTKQLKNTEEEEAHAVQTRSPDAESEEAEQMHLETEEVIDEQKQLDKQKVRMNSTEKLQKNTKSALRQNQDLELLEASTKEEGYSVSTEWDEEEVREIPKNGSTKDQNNAVETKNMSCTPEVLHRGNTLFQENSDASNNKKSTTDNLEENQIAKDSLVQATRTWNKISRQSVALKSRNGMDADEHVVKHAKCIEQNAPKTSLKRKDSKLIDISTDETEKDEKTDDSADEMVDEVSGYQSEDIVNIETLNDSESSEVENVDIETVEELSEKINIARLKATAAHALLSKQLHLVRDHSNKTTKKPKNEEEAFANYRQTHTANERRRRKEMRGLFEKLKATLGLQALPKVSKCFILKQAFEEIQGLTDQADKLSGQKNLLMRKQDTLIRKVSALSGKTQEVVLKKLEYIYAKQKAVEAQKKKQQADPMKVIETAETVKTSEENSSSSLFREMKPEIGSNKRTKPLILSRKGSRITEKASPVTLTNASLVMTAHGQVLAIKSPLLPAQVSTPPSALLQAELKSDVDSRGGATQPGIASVMIQLPGSTVQVKGILPNSTIPITLSAVASSPGSTAVEMAPELASETEDSFMMPRIINVTSLATEENTNLNLEVNNSPYITSDASSQMSEPSLQTASQEKTNLQSEEKASCGKERDAIGTVLLEDFPREEEVFPQIVNVSSLKDSGDSFATRHCIEELAGSQAGEKQTDRGDDGQKAKDSSSQKLPPKEPKDSGIEMELQKVASAIQEVALDASDLIDIEENDDTDETLTSLLNEIAFLNQQLNDDSSDIAELPNSLSSGFSLGDVENRRESSAADASPFQFGALGGSFKDLSVVQESSDSIAPLLLHLDDDDLPDSNRNSRELSSESDALKIMLGSEVKNSNPDHSAVNSDGTGENVDPLAKTRSLTPPILQMKANLEGGNTDTTWRPMPKLAPLGLKGANFPLDSEGRNTKVMPLLAPVAAKEITAQPLTSASQDSKAMPTMPKRKCQFGESLASRYKSFKPGRNQYEAECLVCPAGTYVSVANKGAQALEIHIQSQKHRRSIQNCSSIADIATFVAQSSKPSHAVNAAEATLAFHDISHHSSYRSMDCTPKLNAEIYSDSDVAKKVSCTRTKTEAIVNKVLGPHSVDVTIQCLKGVSCFGVCTDGSSHGSLKIFPILIQFFDYKLGGIQTKLVELKSAPSETSDTVSSYISDTLRQLGIVEKCVAFAGDNANTNLGGFQRSEGNNVFIELKKSVNKNVIGIGCPANILHNAIQHGADTLGINLECIVMKLYNYFSIYTVRTEQLKEYCEFVDINYKQLLSHTKTRWLSLFPAIHRILETYEDLQSYFLSLPRPPKILKTFFTAKLSKAYLWHLHSLMSVFHDSIKDIQKERNSIVDIMNILENVSSQLENRLECSFISIETKEVLSCVQEEGFDTEVDCFMEEAISLYRECYEYLKKWSVSFRDFNCFKWMNLNGKVLMKDVEKCITFLKEKGYVIDNAKYCDQLCNLNIFLERNSAELENWSCNDKWVKYFENSKHEECHSELLKTAEYFFALPGHNADVERIFSLMSAQWTHEKNHLNVDSVKGLLLVKYNYKHFSCSEFYKYVLSQQDILKKIRFIQKIQLNTGGAS
ncbi:MAX gene-associated protein isoform X3 [Tiliqua scincoides]|uniref:MAX gene-associated protein isoform X3 n=1 Tax=Tiliqua scincoides TaxID=71010 RepID=UPI003463582A